MAAVVNAPIQHGGFQHLHRGTLNVSLAKFLQRQRHALLFALRVEGLDKRSIVGDHTRSYSALISANRWMIALKLIALPGVVSSSPSSRQVR